MKRDYLIENTFKESGEQLNRTDPEFVKIVAAFSQSEVPQESQLTEKGR